MKYLLISLPHPLDKNNRGSGDKIAAPVLGSQPLGTRASELGNRLVDASYRNVMKQTLSKPEKRKN